MGRTELDENVQNAIIQSCSVINMLGFSIWSELMTQNCKDTQEILESSVPMFREFRPFLTKERQIEFAVFIQTVSNKLLEEVKEVKKE